MSELHIAAPTNSSKIDDDDQVGGGGGGGGEKGKVGKRIEQHRLVFCKVLSFFLQFIFMHLQYIYIFTISTATATLHQCNKQNMYIIYLQLNLAIKDPRVTEIQQ